MRSASATAPTRPPPSTTSPTRETRASTGTSTCTVVRGPGSSTTGSTSGRVPGDEHRVRRRLDVPRTPTLRTGDLAVGTDPERLAGDRDLLAAQADGVVALAVTATDQVQRVPQASTRPGGERDEHIGQAVARVGVRGQLGASPHAGAVAHRDHQHVPVDVGD